MNSLTDELSSKAISDGSKAIKGSLELSGKAAKETLKTGETLIKGICLVMLDGGAFTTENVMKAVNKVAFKKTGDIKYSKNNIDIAALQKSGHVYKIDENVTADVMKYFDEQCKKYNVKYSAMKDERNPDKPAYMVFFEGKDTDMIKLALEGSYKDYMKAKEKAPSNQKKGRESVRTKLAFFGIGLQLGTENGME